MAPVVSGKGSKSLSKLKPLFCVGVVSKFRLTSPGFSVSTLPISTPKASEGTPPAAVILPFSITFCMSGAILLKSKFNVRPERSAPGADKLILGFNFCKESTDSPVV